MNAIATAVRRRSVGDVAEWLREYVIVIVFVALVVGLSIASPVFFTSLNLLNVLDQSSTLGIVACGMTIIIIGGDFDLSVGAVYAVAAIIAAKVAAGSPPEVGYLAGAAVGAALGTLNGLIVTRVRINSFVATLATQIGYRGFATLITGGIVVTVSDLSFRTIALEKVLGVKLSIWIFAAFVLATWLLLSKTTFGRQVYAVGGNAEAARLSGIRVDRIKVLTFTIGGFAAGVAGVIAASRSSSAGPSLGVGLELSAIAGTIIGGTSILGGEGAIWRTVLGVLILALIGNGFNLLNINPTYQQITQAVLIIAAVGLDTWSRKKMRR
jgi:ribose transport system permease protein